MNKKVKFSACGFKLKKAHKSWGNFYYCSKCGEIDSMCKKLKDSK